MKMTAAAAGGGDKLVQVVEDYYINAINREKGELCAPNLMDEDYYDKWKATGCCKCCWLFLIALGLFIFVLVWGFPGLLHIEKF